MIGGGAAKQGSVYSTSIRIHCGKEQQVSGALRYHGMEHSIRFWHDKCYETFQRLSEAFENSDEHWVDLPRPALEDFFGRFNVWAGNIGAGQQGRVSLDFRLREASEIKDHVISTLRFLLQALQDGESCLVEPASRKLFGATPQGLRQ